MFSLPALYNVYIHKSFMLYNLKLYKALCFYKILIKLYVLGVQKMAKGLRRERYSFAKIEDAHEAPYLLNTQISSYNWFLEEGLKEVFEEISPIEDFSENLVLEFVDYHLGEPKYNEEECRDRDATYAAPLQVKVRLINKDTGEVKEQEVFMGDFPLMTDKGTFIINGAERVVVNQLIRSSGVYFGEERTKDGRRLVSANIIPNRGAWIEFEYE